MTVFVLGLDIGTTSTIGLLLRLPDKVVRVASRPVTLKSPHPGWAEEDPLEWWENSCAIIRQLITKAGIKPDAIKAVGVTGMLPATVLLGKGDELLRPSIQQSDARVGEQIAELRAEMDEHHFLKIAGNGINQQLIATKTRWIERHEPDIFANIATVFGSYDYINWKLTGEKRIEQNWALEAGLTDITKHAIMAELCALTHLPPAAIAPRALSSEIIGLITAKAAEETGLVAGTPVIGGAADMVASSLAAGIVDEGQVLLKFGGAFDILMASHQAKPSPQLFLDYHLMPGLFMPNGCMSTGGSALNWFANNYAGNAREGAAKAGLSLHQYLDRLAASIAAGSEGVSILPYFLGEKTPLHDPHARGAITGLSFNHTLAHLWRALLESYACAARHHVGVFQAAGYAPRQFFASDGGASSLLWMQIVADMLQEPIQLLKNHPGSSLGVAFAAAMAIGAADSWSDINRFVQKGKLIAPNAHNTAIYDTLYQRFHAIYHHLRPLYGTVHSS